MEFCQICKCGMSPPNSRASSNLKILLQNLMPRRRTAIYRFMLVILRKWTKKIPNNVPRTDSKNRNYCQKLRRIFSSSLVCNLVTNFQERGSSLSHKWTSFLLLFFPDQWNERILLQINLHRTEWLADLMVVVYSFDFSHVHTLNVN